MKIRRLAVSLFVSISFIVLFAGQMVLAKPVSRDIQNLYKGAKAFEHLETLVEFGPRVAGSAAESAAADYIASQMESYGLDVEIQVFDILYYEELSVPELEQTSPNPTDYAQYDDFITMTYSGSGSVVALVQPAVDIMIPPGPDANDSTCGCEPADFAGFVPGNIALVQRGTCSFFDKALNAENAGAVGVIILNEGQEGRTDAFFGTLGGPGVTIPVVGASFALGEELYKLTLTGDVEVRLLTDVITEERVSQNVIGTLEGKDPEQGIVYIGGHYDSVSTGPGANDNASGTAAVLEAARVLTTKGHKTKATLKFIAFGAEEIGLDGSYWYVNDNYDEVNGQGIGMINLDMIGVGDTLLIGNIGLADMDLTEYTQAKAEAMSIGPWEPFTAGSNSDHYYFEVAGVPVVFLNQSDDPYYHTSEDTPDKIDLFVFEQNGELATSVMRDWAKNPKLRAKKAMKFEKIHVHKDKVHKVK